MKNHHRAWFWGFLSFAMLIFIFSNSLQNGEESSAASDFVTEICQPLLVRAELTADEGTLLIRKLAHFSEFALLGGLFCAMANAISLPSPNLAAAYGGTLAAVADEFIQRFVDGRSSQVSDVVIDLAGVLTGLCVCLLLRRLFAKRTAANSKQAKRVKSAS